MTALNSEDSPVYLKLRATISAAILRGDFRAGDQLPSVRALAAEHGANPLTVAKAYQSFQDDGYVEVRRGRHVIVARVVWSKSDRFGARTQDPLAVDAIAAGRDDIPSAEPSPVDCALPERRVHPRTQDVHERSRLWGRSLEFGFVLLAGISLTAIGAGFLGEAVAKPLQSVTNALN